VSTADSRRRASPTGGLTERDAARWIVAASLLLVGCVAMFLAARRFAGAVSSPPPSAVLLSSVILCVWATAVGAWDSRDGRWAIGILALVAIVCSYPGNRWIDWTAWLPALALSWWLPQTRWRLQWRRASSSHGIVPAAALSSDVVLQDLTRTRTADEGEIVRGTLLAEFSPGERTAALHVGFCPPFERLPRCEAQPFDSKVASVKLIQVLHHGAHIEVRLARPATTAQTVVVGFLATDIRR
jgi:hypothetical protein